MSKAKDRGDWVSVALEKKGWTVRTALSRGGCSAKQKRYMEQTVSEFRVGNRDTLPASITAVLNRAFGGGK